MSEAVIIVPGKPEESFACITADTRPHPSHCWARAADHISKNTGFSFFVRLEAESVCKQMVQAILKLRIPPQKSPVKWGWGKGWPGIR